MTILTGDTEFFPGIGRIPFEGPASKNPPWPSATTTRTGWSPARP